VSQTVSQTVSETVSQTVSETVSQTVSETVCDTVCDTVCGSSRAPQFACKSSRMTLTSLPPRSTLLARLRFSP